MTATDTVDARQQADAVVVWPQAMDAVRYYFGRRNLARKTLVDERFLI